MRRLPVYIVADTSGSMTGAPIEAVNQGIEFLYRELLGDPNASETAFLSLISFNDTVTQEQPLSELSDFQLPSLTSGGLTDTAAALEKVAELVKQEVQMRSSKQNPGDWKPLLFLMSDGNATSSQYEMDKAILEFKKVKWGHVICCAMGNNIDPTKFHEISETVVSISQDPDSIKQFFQWISSSVSETSRSVGTMIGLPEADSANPSTQLPPPPSAVRLVLPNN